MAHIVNPAGYVHEIDDDDVDTLMSQDGYRLADKAEVANYYAVQGLKAPTGKATPKGKAFDKAEG